MLKTKGAPELLIKFRNSRLMSSLLLELYIGAILVYRFHLATIDYENETRTRA